jgi:cell wall-associated NlpC family hydrolase
MTGDAVVSRARSLIGCGFRPQGRDVATGLDCVGLVCAAFQIEGVPRDYRLRGGSRDRLATQLDRYFTPVPTHEAQSGDVLMFAVTHDQLHLGILTDRGVIHADGRLRKVVERPGSQGWTILSAHRRTIEE